MSSNSGWDDTYDKVLLESVRVKLRSTVNGFFDGVLHTLPALVLKWAPIQAWHGRMPVERSPSIVPDDSHVVLYEVWGSVLLRNLLPC